MNPIQLGSTLLHKYRIDRFRRRKDGVLLYEGVDTLHPRRVCIALLDRAAVEDVVKCARFHDEAHGANVIDIGTSNGLPYFVTAMLAPPVPRPSKRPPPLPKPPSSKPPPLPKPTLPPLPPIPIVVDDRVILDAPPPPISSETLVPTPTAFEVNPFKPKRSPWVPALAAMVCASAIGGWYVGQMQAEIAPAAAPEPMLTPSPAETIAPPVPIAVEAAAKPQPSNVVPEPPASSSKPRAHPPVDPLTL